MTSKNKAWIRLIAILSLSLVVVASAEDLSHGGYGLDGGRSFVDPSGNVNNLNSILGSCAVGRPGIGGIGAVAPNQSSIGFDNGILQASVPEGAPGGTGGGVVAGGVGSTAGATPDAAALFQSKCLSCHRPGGQAEGKAITQSTGSIRLANRTMPPVNSPQANGMTDEERAAIAAFLPSLGR